MPTLPSLASPLDVKLKKRARKQYKPPAMSSRTSRTSRITEDEINELILKLQAVIQEIRQRGSTRASASKVLKETCNYIKRLHREVDDLSERLSELMASMESNSVEADILRSLLDQ